MIFIAAAGNNGPNAPPAYPAAYPDVIAVTATDEKDSPYTKDNQGRTISSSRHLGSTSSRRR